MLFPEARRALEMYAGETPVFAEGYDIDAARADARAVAAGEPREDVAEVADVDADGVPARLYTPVSTGSATDAVIVHAHGGGFVLNDVEVHDASVRRLANRSGMRVLSVDYRRPPEHRFPAAIDDVGTASGWAERTLGGPLVAHGDSAGGNLALVDALRHPGRYGAVALVYPFLDPTAGFESYRTHADGFDPREAAWYWDHYATSDDHTNPDLAPLLSDRLGTLPPTLVITAEHDPLRDEGEELANRIAEAGVEVVASRYLGQLHGFWRHPQMFPAAETVMGQVAAFLRLHSDG